MTLDLDELRRLAEAATPGPWRTVAVTYFDAPTEWAHLLGPRRRSEWFGNKDAAFIAAANPATVLTLLDRLAAAEALLVESQGALYTIHDNAYIDGLTDRIAAHLAGKDGVK